MRRQHRILGWLSQWEILLPKTSNGRRSGRVTGEVGDVAFGMFNHAIPSNMALKVFKDTFGDDKPIVELANTGHFLQEDAPDLLVALIEQFMQST